MLVLTRFFLQGFVASSTHLLHDSPVAKKKEKNRIKKKKKKKKKLLTYYFSIATMASTL
jgi:hypothetical protein